VETEPPSDPQLDLVRWETAAAFISRWEAELARACLETAGIPAIVADDHLGSLVAWNLVGGFKVRVPPEEHARAIRLLAGRRPPPELYLVGDDEPAERRCPHCNSDNLTEERLWRRPARFHCHTCGQILELEAGEADLKKADEPKAPADAEGEIRHPDLVPVARFFTPWEAHLACTRLEASGIRACVLEERLPPIDLWTGQPRALNRVAVLNADAAHAAEILADPTAPFDDGEEAHPDGEDAEIAEGEG
jgi:hypothetical protein